MESSIPQKTELSPYLAFNGNCKSALNFYQSVLGGKIDFNSFGEGPMEVAESDKGKIMHAHFAFDDCNILASDTTSDRPLEVGNNYHLSLVFPEKDRAKKVYEKLSEGGVRAMPFGEVFWGGSFGMLVDKFGIQWMVSCP
jgi:PhnB protein